MYGVCLSIKVPPVSRPDGANTKEAVGRTYVIFESEAAANSAFDSIPGSQPTLLPPPYSTYKLNCVCLSQELFALISRAGRRSAYTSNLEDTSA